MLRRLFGQKPDLTRKLIHVGAGMWVFGVLALFNRWESGILPNASVYRPQLPFLPLPVSPVSHRRVSRAQGTGDPVGLFGAMDTEDSSPGTVYFAVSVTLLFGLMWRPNGPVDRAPIAVAGVMAMTWGDAYAALIGRRFGRHRYQVWGSERSSEGTERDVRGEHGGDVPGAVAATWFVANVRWQHLLVWGDRSSAALIGAAFATRR